MCDIVNEEKVGGTGDSSETPPPPIHSLSPSALLMLKSHHLPFVRYNTQTHTQRHVSLSQQICFRLITVSGALTPPPPEKILSYICSSSVEKACSRAGGGFLCFVHEGK